MLLNEQEKYGITPKSERVGALPQGNAAAMPDVEDKEEIRLNSEPAEKQWQRFWIRLLSSCWRHKQRKIVSSPYLSQQHLQQVRARKATHTSTTFPTSRSPHSTRLRRSVSKSDVDISWLSTSCAKTGLCKNRWRSRQGFCRCWEVERRTRQTVR